MTVIESSNGTTEYLVQLTVSTSVSIYVRVDDKKQLLDCDYDFLEAGLITDEALLTALSRTMHRWGALDIVQDGYQMIRRRATA